MVEVGVSDELTTAKEVIVFQKIVLAIGTLALVSMLAVSPPPAIAGGTEQVTLELYEQGEFRGRWSSPGGYVGDLVLTVKAEEAFIRFEGDADKSCKGDKRLPTDIENGRLVLHSPFRLNVGGKCGEFSVTMKFESPKLTFVFERLKWDDEFHGDVLMSMNE